MKFNYSHIILSLLAAALIVSGCSDNSSSSSSEMDALAVFAVNTGSGDFDLQTDSSNNIDFCYEGEGCTETSGMTFISVFEGQRMDVDISSTDKKAVGVKVGMIVTEGEGRFEVVRGNAYRDDGFLEFDEDEVVFTSETFSEGDTVYFEYGQVD